MSPLRRWPPLLLTVVALVSVACGAATTDSTNDLATADASPPTTLVSPPSTTVTPDATTTTLAVTTTTEATPAPAPSPEMQLAPRPTDPPVTPAPKADPTPTRAPLSPAGDVSCEVTLHGKGGGGAATTVGANGVVRLAPSGNAAGWGGRQWLYATAADRAAIAATVRAAIDAAGCDRVAIHGFSNGAAALAALYCTGESFDGRLVLAVVDDPVTDHAVEGCAPARGVALALYWTGALAGQAPAGWACANADWTCAGGTSIGIDAYAASLRATIERSPMGGHALYPDPPELQRFRAA